MTKRCKNCQRLVGKGKFCSSCGEPQEEENMIDIPDYPVEEVQTVGKKVMEMIKGKPPTPLQTRKMDTSTMPEFQPPQHTYPDKPKQQDYSEQLNRIEKKMDMILETNSWLVACVDNWVQGYKQKPEPNTKP